MEYRRISALRKETMKDFISANFKTVKSWLFSLLITVGIVTLFSVNLTAQSSSSSSSSSEQETEQLIKQERRLPLLNGHTFIASSILPQTPFITTYVRNSTGVARALSYDIPIYDPEGEVITTINGDLTYMMLELSYQHAINDWLALWLSGAGVGRVGVNAESILSTGISGAGALELGGLARIWNNDKFILSGVLSLRHNKLIGVDIIGFARSIIDTGIIDTGNLFIRIPSWRWKGGLRFAFAPNDLWGIILSTDFGRGDSLKGEETNDTVFDIAGLVSLDLNARTKIPIGFVFGYKHTSYPETSGDIVENSGVTTFRIAYTGRREFSIGLEFGYARAPLIKKEKTLNYGSMFINLQYYF